ncbi:MAG: hypothetical protein Q8R25_02240 [bacterium]|nr:hypothetical protein [bacterium]
MDAQQRGDLSESRAFSALSRLQEDYPHKFRHLRRTSPGTDARGVDLFIELNVSKGRQRSWMTVPIEIKSSRMGVAKWRVTHPEHYKAGVLHFYILNRMDEKGLCQLFFRALDKVRHNARDGTLFHSWFQKLYEGRMSRRGRENVRKITARRDKEKKR